MEKYTFINAQILQWLKKAFFLMIKIVTIKFYHIPSFALSTLYTLFYCILTKPLQSRSYYLNFTKEYLQSREMDSNPSLFDLKFRSFY